jgi:hypothetical protein
MECNALHIYTSKQLFPIERKRYEKEIGKSCGGEEEKKSIYFPLKAPTTHLIITVYTHPYVR